MSNEEEWGTFRDKLGTIGEKGERLWIYAKKPKGPLYNWRRMLAYVLTAIFFIGPFIKFKGDPVLLLNIFERKFVILGVIFWPQDFHLLVMSMIAFMIFIVLFTVIFGRLFCGWVCPQTVFMEFLYRQIEYWIEGSHIKQRKLDDQAMNFEKFWKKTLKHIIFFIISFATINAFLAYLIGIDDVKQFYLDGFSKHIGRTIGLFAFTLVHYFVFAKFREQVCIIACPYGRLQGVLLDKNSINVTYDYKRGEPRKGSETDGAHGDCVACDNCVAVCPTGVDIRNGTQLECINCTACMDACNQVMEKVKKPKGLIRYASEQSLAVGSGLKISGRIIFYSAFLTVLLILIGYLFTIRTDVETTILRVQGTMFQEYDSAHYSNIYSCQVINKTRNEIPVELSIPDGKGEIKLLGNPLVVKKGEPGEVKFLVLMPKSEVKSSNNNITFAITSNGKEIERVESRFVGPNSLDNQ